MRRVSLARSFIHHDCLGVLTNSRTYGSSSQRGYPAGSQRVSRSYSAPSDRRILNAASYAGVRTPGTISPPVPRLGPPPPLRNSVVEVLPAADHNPSHFGIDASVCRVPPLDRKSTRLNSSHLVISYAVFSLYK